MDQLSFQLRFRPDKIIYWASRYSYSRGEEGVAKLGRKARKQGYLTHEDLLQFFVWKTNGRGISRCKMNTSSYVEELTGVAFTAKEDRLRVEILRLLDGVQWPVASAILHFVFPDQYPILDYRALWSLGFDSVPTYNYSFWKAYTDNCRRLAIGADVDLRTLDRALWQYSKENQKPV